MKRVLQIVMIVVGFFGCLPKSMSIEKSALGLLLYRSNMANISGKAIKGDIKAGKVDVFRLAADGTCDESQILSSSLTDENGNYSLSYQKTGSLVCVRIRPVSAGNTRVYDEKLGMDLPILDSGKLNLTHILREELLSASKKEGLFVSPFSRMLARRLDVLVQSNPSSNLNTLTKRASKEIVIRFGLSKGV